MPFSAPDDNSRLEDALRVYLRWKSDGSHPPADEFLASHPDLRDLLEPMLEDEPVSPAESRDSSGSRWFGDFEILGEIGRGGMGVVFEARHRKLGRRVALKVLPAHLTLQSQSVERFRREAATMARLRHPGIAQVFEVGQCDDGDFFAMEFIDGAPLDKVLHTLRDEDPSTIGAQRIATAVTAVRHKVVEDHPEPSEVAPTAEEIDLVAKVWSRSYVEAVVELAAQVADALAHAHGNGVIHRDIKPSNILVRHDGSVVVTDFGLAREEGSPALTITGDFAGTPHYVSPEQAMSKRVPVDHRSDLFSLGVTLYELLTLRRPFEGGTMHDVLARIVTKEPPAADKVNPRLAPDLVAITEKALQKDPDRRYQTAEAFAQDLRAFLDYRPVMARRASTPARVARWIRREPLKAALAIGGVFSVLAIAGLGGYVLASQSEIEEGRAAQRTRAVRRELDRGYLALFSKSHGEAEQALNAALALDPANPEAIAGLAQVFLEDHRAQEALALLDRLQEDSRAPRALDRSRAEVLRHVRRDDEALALEAGFAAPRSALEFFLAGTTAFNRARAGFERDEEWAEAARLFRGAALRAPANVLYLGSLAFAVNRGEKVDAHPREAADVLVDVWPDSSAAHHYAGLSLYRVDPDEARRRLTEATRLDPTSAVAWRSLGNLIMDAFDPTEAIEPLLRAQELNPDDPVAQLCLSVAYGQSGQLDKSLEHSRRAATLRPSEARAYSNQGNVHSIRGDHELAIASFRRAIEVRPDYPNGHHNLLESLRIVGNADGERAEHERWLRICPDDPYAHNAMAWFLVDPEREHDDADAEAAAEAAARAVELCQGPNPSFLHTLAEARFAVGDLAGARSALEAARQALPPEGARRDRLLGELRASKRRFDSAEGRRRP